MTQPTSYAQLSKKQRAWQLVKFTMFSISAGLIQIGSFTLLNEIVQLPEWISYLTALILSVLWNFTFNRRYTFKSAANIPKAMMLVFLYYAVFTPISTWWVDALTGIGWNEYIVVVATMLINFLTEFLYQSMVVFKKSMNTNALASKTPVAEDTTAVPEEA